MYQVIFLPYILSFSPDLGSNFNYFEFVVDLIFCIDMGLQFNVAFVLSADYEYQEKVGTAPRPKRSKKNHFSKKFRDGLDNMTVQYETKRREIAKYYFSSWFVIDFLAVAPLLIQVFNAVALNASLFPEPGSSSFAGFAKSLRVPRLLRLLKVARVLQTFRANNRLRRLVMYSRYTNLFKILMLIIVILLFNHFVACMWWFLSKDIVLSSSDIMDSIAEGHDFNPYTYERRAKRVPSEASDWRLWGLGVRE